MKLKQLEGLLGGLDQFPNPKVELEQYPTGPHIASRMLFTAENSFEDISNKVVADFGCGCGTLGVAAALLTLIRHVLSIDIDPESLEIASLNAEELEVDMDFIQSNVMDLRWRGSTSLEVKYGILHLLNGDIWGQVYTIFLVHTLGQIVDTVIMNPPFGTRKKGADLDFLNVALKVASQAVYSLHKSSTREHVKRTALRDFNACNAEVLCELRYDLPKLYKFHKKKEVDIAVDLWRFVPGKHQS
ncbi:hypothetical protein Ahy_B05g074786 isoform A [Arachis hypogaea]|uniref:Methyltransferase-like protein 5 n=1 Tax=Arachis hypogaea TaxID=3818 RepID=A0A444YZS8_ARAHY|nr:hypothetical protein Ahy_B05g074786 isoform A [Arachis hypogaea]